MLEPHPLSVLCVSATTIYLWTHWMPVGPIDFHSLGPRTHHTNFYQNRCTCMSNKQLRRFLLQLVWGSALFCHKVPGLLWLFWPNWHVQLNLSTFVVEQGFQILPAYKNQILYEFQQANFPVEYQKVSTQCYGYRTSRPTFLWSTKRWVLNVMGIIPAGRLSCGVPKGEYSMLWVSYQILSTHYLAMCSYFSIKSLSIVLQDPD